MKKISSVLLASLMVACSANPSTDSAKGNYEPTWESLSQHQEIPEWLQDAKLGIYFTWGVYTVPAYGSEWYPYHMYRPNDWVAKHHLETYGPDVNYHDFVDDFTAENFDGEEWAKLFKSSGARFAGPCAIHHDGFAMWDSEVTPWNAADKGPKQDITGELFEALRKEGIKTLTTFHHARNGQRNANRPEEWVSGGRSDCGYNSHFAYDPSLITSTKDPELAKLYGNVSEAEFNQYWYDIVAEVVDKYSPDMIWFDSWLNLIPEKRRQEMAAHYYNEAARKGQDVTIGYKQYDMPLEVGILDIEQGGKKELSERVWMTDVTLSFGSWSYVNGQTYKTPEMVLRNMIDVWSKNGIALLNISPMSNGTIPDAQREVLGSLGEWLHTYGEAVYGTRPFINYGFGKAATSDNVHGGQSATTKYTADDVRFTMSKDGKNLYVIFLGKPKAGEKIKISSLAGHRYPTPTPVKRITLLGTDVEAKYTLDTNNFFLTIPDAPMNELATVFKFELE